MWGVMKRAGMGCGRNQVSTGGIEGVAAAILPTSSRIGTISTTRTNGRIVNWDGDLEKKWKDRSVNHIVNAPSNVVRQDS